MNSTQFRLASLALSSLIAVGSAWAQDQQIGARTKAMGGSYTAFEDDPVSVWLNPAGIATQPDQMSIAYQTFTGYPVKEKRGSGDTVDFEVNAKTVFVDPAILPSYLGLVFQLGNPDSPMAVGVCVARPYHLNYALDKVTDPNQTDFKPQNNLDQGYIRFRGAFAKDFRFRKAGETGFFPHLSVGAGIDLAVEHWEFTTPERPFSDTTPGLGFGAGILLGIYDNTDWLKINLGAAYQSKVGFSFNIEPDILPAFDMPQQINVGVTAYLLPGTPLRFTADFQWINWGATAEAPFFSNQPTFEDAFNFSVGAEYRIGLSETVFLYPRVGYRRFDAPWEDPKNLPATGAFKLVLDTDDEAFHLFTFGAGISWASEAAKLRSVDVAADVGGDTVNLALGYTHGF